MIQPSDVLKNLAEIKKKLNGYPLKIIAVTKYHPAEIYEICRKVGLDEIAENRAQAVRDKCTPEKMNRLKVHFISPVQIKNIKYLVGRIDSFDALDSLELARALSARWQRLEHPLSVLMQVNASNEPQKSGFNLQNKKELHQAARSITLLPGLKLEGLLAMGPTPHNNYDRGDVQYENDLIAAFLQTQETHKSLQNEIGQALPRLSMGMSHDYDVAANYGATEARIGTLLWQRPQN